MQRIELKVSFEDERGKIIDLLEKQPIDTVTIVTFTKGALRGDHYHQHTTQWNYLLSGRVAVKTRMPDGPTADEVMNKGDFIVSVPTERHTFRALEDAEMLVLTKGPRGGKDYQSDTFRSESPLFEKALGDSGWE